MTELCPIMSKPRLVPYGFKPGLETILCKVLCDDGKVDGVKCRAWQLLGIRNIRLGADSQGKPTIDVEDERVYGCVLMEGGKG